MSKSHIKRINAPKNWNILRKTHTFVSRPNPGRKLELAVSLNTALKDLLGITRTTKESKHLIKNKGVQVNAVTRYDEKFPIGFLDVLTLPTAKEHYRLTINKKNKLTLIKINDQEAKIKVSKIVNKSALSKEKTQINCSDGRNFEIKTSDKLSKAKTNEAVVYTVPGQKIQEILKLEKGALVFLYKGKHAGNAVTIKEVKGNTIYFKLGNEEFQTKKIYALPIGKEKAIIKITEK